MDKLQKTFKHEIKREKDILFGMKVQMYKRGGVAQCVYMTELDLCTGIYRNTK